MKGAVLKKIKLDESDTMHHMLEITKLKTVSTASVQHKFIGAEKTKNDIVYSRTEIAEDTFAYHMSNNCYKRNVHLLFR